MSRRNPPRQKGRDAWIIEWRSIDPSRDAIVAYQNRQKAVGAAADFIKQSVDHQLETYELSSEQEDVLEEIMDALNSGETDEAIMEWLDYQHEYEPDETFAIGPSGAVSDSPSDFQVTV